MTTEHRWNPSPQLARAVRAALQHLASHWSRALALAFDTSVASDRFIADYARALLGAELDAIAEAAEQWIAQNDYAPKPKEFAELAKSITARHRAARQYSGPALARDKAPVPTVHEERLARCAALSKRAHSVLGSWALVTEVWTLLHQFGAAAPDEQRRAWLDGFVELDVFYDVVQMVKDGKRADVENPLDIAL